MQSVDDILGVLEEWAANKQPIEPAEWINASLKLVALLGNESDRLFILQQKIARQKMELMQGGFTAAKARAFVEAEDIYWEAKHQEAKIKRVEELIRLSKQRARLADSEMRLQ